MNYQRIKSQRLRNSYKQQCDMLMDDDDEFQYIYTLDDQDQIVQEKNKPTIVIDESDDTLSDPNRKKKTLDSESETENGPQTFDKKKTNNILQDQADEDANKDNKTLQADLLFTKIQNKITSHLKEDEDILKMRQIRQQEEEMLRQQEEEEKKKLFQQDLLDYKEFKKLQQMELENKLNEQTQQEIQQQEESQPIYYQQPEKKAPKPRQKKQSLSQDDPNPFTKKKNESMEQFLNRIQQNMTRENRKNKKNRKTGDVSYQVNGEEFLNADILFKESLILKQVFMTYQAPPKISKSRYNKEFLLTYDDDSEDFGKKSKGRKRSKKQEPKTGQEFSKQLKQQIIPQIREVTQKKIEGYQLFYQVRYQEYTGLHWVNYNNLNLESQEAIYEYEKMQQYKYFQVMANNFIPQVSDSNTFCWLSHKFNGDKVEIPKLNYLKKEQEQENESEKEREREKKKEQKKKENKVNSRQEEEVEKIREEIKKEKEQFEEDEIEEIQRELEMEEQRLLEEQMREIREEEERKQKEEEEKKRIEKQKRFIDDDDNTPMNKKYSITKYFQKDDELNQCQKKSDDDFIPKNLENRKEKLFHSPVKTKKLEFSKKKSKKLTRQQRILRRLDADESMMNLPSRRERKEREKDEQFEQTRLMQIGRRMFIQCLLDKAMVEREHQEEQQFLVELQRITEKHKKVEKLDQMIEDLSRFKGKEVIAVPKSVKRFGIFAERRPLFQQRLQI